jgi:PAS domain-containing protein
LTRQLASYLAMPIFLVGPEGNLLYYNEPAEALLGHRYEESGELTAEVWSTVWEARTDEGKPLPPEEIALMKALTTRQPVHQRVSITGLDGTPRRLEVTAFPLEGQGGRHLGAVAIFWESKQE